MGDFRGAELTLHTDEASNNQGAGYGFTTFESNRHFETTLKAIYCCGAPPCLTRTGNLMVSTK